MAIAVRCMLLILFAIQSGSCGYRTESQDDSVVAGNNDIMTTAASEILALLVGGAPGSVDARIMQCGYSGSLLITVPTLRLKWDVPAPDAPGALEALMDDLLAKGYLRGEDDPHTAIGDVPNASSPIMHFFRQRKDWRLNVSAYIIRPAAADITDKTTFDWAVPNRVYLSLSVEPNGCT